MRRRKSLIVTDRPAQPRSRKSFAALGRGFALALVSLLVLGFGASPSQAARYASIVIDVDTGRVLHNKDGDVVAHPASLTKMMTLYMLFDAMRDGKVKLNTRMPVSARAEGQTPTKLGLRQGQTIAVEDAIKALVVRSANDVATVVAEFLGGTEVNFATMMTQRARALGMSKTTFRNASGLHNPAQVSTARDMATLSIALRRDFPQHYHYFNTRSFRWGGQTIHSHNRVLGQYRGADGLKTGFIRASGFNLASSATRNGRTLVGVVFGGQTAAWRDQHMISLLDRGFASAGVMATLPRPLPKPDPLLASASPDASTLVPTPPAAALAPVAAPAHVDVARPTLLEPVAPSVSEPGAIAALPGGPTTGPVTGPANPAPRTWGIQVGAFSAFDSASSQATKAATRLRQEVPGLQAAVTSVRSDNGMIYRARVIGLSSESAARDACSRLGRWDGGCVVVRPDGMDLALIR